MKPLTNADRRRIVYNYYREQGYSRNEAQSMRGRWKSVWLDFIERANEVKAFGGTPPPAPKLPLSTKTKADIKSQLIQKGISKRVAGQWINLRPDRLLRRVDNLDKYFATIKKELLKTKSKKKADQIIKRLVKQIGKYRTNSELFDLLGEYYDLLLGV